MKFNDQENLAEVLLDANLKKNDIKEMHEIIDRVARDDFDVCVCMHANKNNLQFMGVDDIFSVEYINISEDKSIYKIQDKTKVNETQEVQMHSAWGGGSFEANDIITCDQTKAVYDCYFKTDKFDEFKKDIEKLGFVVKVFDPFA